MTATDELRLPNDTNELDMLLNERGQEHRVWPSGRVVWHDESTVYEYEPAKNHHDEYWGGILRMTMRHLTPEQAIAATLGSCNCSDNCTNGERTNGTCEADETDLIPFVRADSGDFEVDYIHVMECSSCGGTYEYVNGDYEYCPRCGRKREDVSE